MLGLVVVERRVAVAWLNPSVFGDEDVLVAVGEFGDGRAEDHVNSRADVTRAEGLDGEVWVDFANDLGGIAVGEVGVAVEENGDDSVGVNGGLVAAQLRDFADNGDGAADEAVEVGGGDAGGGHLFSHGWR